jgi:pyruvate/2-oxoglutarate dehydrogenase complex dihydrolipoamide dehydrogenase (E3) component
MSADFDVLVIGGGPAGLAAARSAAARGAKTGLIEQERLGGTCVNVSCIPTEIYLGAAHTALSAVELAAGSVLVPPAELKLPALVRRKDGLIRQLAGGLDSALRMAGVERIAGHASFTGPDEVQLAGAGRLSADAFVLAAGAPWEVPEVTGVPAPRVVTADVVQSWTEPPKSAVVAGGGIGAARFALEYAYLLAVLGTEVTLAVEGTQLLPGLDSDLGPMLLDGLTTLGVTVYMQAASYGAALDLDPAVGAAAAEVVVVADPRRPSAASLGLPAAGLPDTTPVEMDRYCRTAVPHIFAAGDLVGGACLTGAAEHTGAVAGANAAGDDLVARAEATPVVLNMLPGVGYVGATEAQARAQHREVQVGFSDLQYAPYNLTRGGEAGAVKVIAGDLGEIVGVHAAGAGCGEIITAAAALIQCEALVTDVAVVRGWHPSALESLAEAARAACAWP